MLTNTATPAATSVGASSIHQISQNEATRGTSGQALQDLGTGAQKHQEDRVLDIVIAAKRNGIKDLSLREIAQRWHMVHGQPIDVGTVSARVTSLVAAKRLVRVIYDARACTVSGKTVQPVSVPVRQAGLL